MNTYINIESPVVSVEWLHQNCNADNLVILDGTIKKTNDALQKQIPKARFFDIKNKFSDQSQPFPNTFPSAEQFQKEARNLGINNTSAIVVYDDKGIYSSARVWWLFKAFGFNNVAVLNGGLACWIDAGFTVEPQNHYNYKEGDFIAKPQSNVMCFFNDVKKASDNKTHKIIDARSAARFNCLEAEPREGLRRGNIPNSKNIPYSCLITNAGLLKSKRELQTIFSEVISRDDSLIFSCGSGITACILALGADICGYKNIAVYDGSWTEWGTLIK